MTEIRLCRFQTYAGSFHVDPEPPEYCEREVESPDDEFCPAHEIMAAGE